MKKNIFLALLSGLAISASVNAQMGMDQSLMRSQFPSLQISQVSLNPQNLILPEIKNAPVLELNADKIKETKKESTEQGTRLETAELNKVKKNNRKKKNKNSLPVALMNSYRLSVVG
ncbi:MAG: hypothetical protein IAF38_19810 [Bacteroidia bacterium]|nr:hypothetical protein [Bacteroidia bacterium]